MDREKHNIELHVHAHSQGLGSSLVYKHLLLVLFKLSRHSQFDMWTRRSFDLAVRGIN